MNRVHFCRKPLAPATIVANVARIAIVAALAFAPAAPAIDGVVQVNQARALAGFVTAGDTPGFPVTLAQGGSYRLTGPLDVSGQPNAENTTAILVTGSHVTLDLNGFSVIGPVTCTGSPVSGCSPSGTAFGILASGVTAFHLRDGFVRGFAGSGVFATDATIENVHAFSNGAAGLYVNGSGVVDGCAAIGNGNDGIYGVGIVIRSSRALENGGRGLTASPGQIFDSEAVHNTAAGVTAAYGLASRNIVRANLGCQLNGFEGAYGHNVISGTGSLACNGTAFGENLCNGALCP